MNIVVIGSRGFIGKHLVKSLKKEKHFIIEVDTILGNDITSWESVKEIKCFDVLFHLAAKSFIPDSYKYPREFYFTNITGTINSLELCRLNNAKMIYISSYVYGIPNYLPIDENHERKAFNPYSRTKNICEDICKDYHEEFDIPITIFRPFNIFGSGQRDSFLIPQILNQLQRGKIVLNDPRPKRDYIHINDVVEAFSKALYLNGFNLLNIGSGKSYSIEEIIKIIIKLSGEKFEVKYLHSYRPEEVLDTIADIRLANKVLNWTPKISLFEGLSELIKEFQFNNRKPK